MLRQDGQPRVGPPCISGGLLNRLLQRYKQDGPSRRNTTPHGHATVSGYPFHACSVASAVRGPWGRWSMRKSASSGRRVTSRVPPYRPLTNRASSSLDAGAGAQLAVDQLRQRLVVVFGALLHDGRGRSSHRASSQNVGAAAYR